MSPSKFRWCDGAPSVIRLAESDRWTIYRLQREAEAAQESGDIGKATELGQMKLEAVRRLYGVAS